MKVAIFSDPHHGLALNDAMFHKISLDFYEWFRNVCYDHQVSEIWCAGDVFHNRKEINLPTMKNAYDCFDLLEDYPVKVIVGNHDAFYLDNSSVHSLDLFKNWPNITVIDREEDFILNDKRIKFIPWVGKDYRQTVDACDCAVVHMELIGFEMNSVNCLHGTNPAIFANCPLVISGHFHKHQDRRFKDTRIYYAGSPYQHDWGELDNKYVHILDLETMELTKVENDVSPKHYYIDDPNTNKNITGNFIRIKIDDEKSEKDFSELIEKHSPLNVTFDRVIKEDAQKVIITDFKNIETLPIIEEFIDSLNEDLNVKQRVKLRNAEIYEKNTKGV